MSAAAIKVRKPVHKEAKIPAKRGCSRVRINFISALAFFGITAASLVRKRVTLHTPCFSLKMDSIVQNWQGGILKYV